jgi:hypothetical protein
VFKRQKRPPVIDDDRFPWLAGAVAIADKITEFRAALVDFEVSWVLAARSQDEAELAAALAKDDAQEALENEALSMMQAWRDSWFTDDELRATLRFAAVYGAITAMHIGVTLEAEVFSRQLQLPDPEDQEWLGARNGQGLELATAARQQLDMVVSRGMDDLRILQHSTAEASHLFSYAQRTLEEVCQRYPEL